MEPDQKKQKLATVLKWSGGIVGAAIVSPIILLALKGVLGLLAIGVAAGAGLTMLKLSPIVSMKVSNLLIKGIVREASLNPIETMQNLLVEKSAELREADLAIVDFETEVRNYDDQTVQFSRDYPEEAESFKEISTKMHVGLEQQKSSQNDARQQLIVLEQQINKAQAIYKMSLAANKVTAFSKSAEKEVFQNIRERVALDSVRTQLNRSFASLNMAISQRQAPMLPAVKQPVNQKVIVPEYTKA